ncbi:MAG: BA14K family protein, partial [Alphaproteobacteria bacterium]
MKQALLSIGVALALSAALPTLADAQGRGGHGGGGISAGGGGGGGGM